MGLWKILIPNTTPYEPINYCINPSVERLLDGHVGVYDAWTYQGGITLTRAGTAGGVSPYSGGWMAKVVAPASTDTLICPSFAPSVSGLNCLFSFSLYAASSDTFTIRAWSNRSPYTFTDLTTVTGTNGWQRVTVGANIVPSSSCGLAITGAGTYYVDALDYAAVSGSSDYVEREYVDGDQPGCSWDEEPHDSISILDYQSRDGGTWYDMADYGLHVIQPGGIGMPPVYLNSQRRSTGDGAIYTGQIKTSRILGIAATEIGASRTDLHARRAWLIDAIKNSRVKGNQPFWLEYYGGSKPVRIKAVYNDGLQVAQFLGFSEDVILSLVAFDPDFIASNQGSALLETSTTDDLHNVLRVNSNARINAGGNAEFSTFPGLTDSIRALEVSQNGVIYAGGDFTDTSPTTSAPVSRIAKYDKTNQAWADLAGGLNAIVYSLLPLPNGSVVAGGGFTEDALAAPLGYIGLYSSTGWGGFSGTDFDTNVYALALDPATNNILAGGAFTTGGGISLGYIGAHSSTGWGAVGTSTDFNGSVRCIKFDKNGNIFASGLFTSAGTNLTAQYIAKRSSTGGEWLTLGASTSDAGPIYTLAIGPDNTLYAGGAFTAIGGVSANYIAAFDGQRWKPLGTGLASSPNGMVFDAAGKLHVVGNSATAGGYPSPYYAVWNGSSWERTGVSLTVTNLYAIALDKSRGELYFGMDGGTGAEFAAVNVVRNYGSEWTRPRFVFYRSGGTSYTITKIKNITTGDEIFTNYALGDGEYVTFDTQKGIVESSHFGNITGNVGVIIGRSDISNFRLLPGYNRVAIYAIPVGAPAVEAFAVWDERHLSADGTSST